MTLFLLKHQWILYFIPLVVGILNFRKLDKGLKLIFYYLIIGLVSEILNYVFISFVKVSNSMPIGHFYYFASSLILGLYYLNQLDGYINRKLIIIIIVCFELFTVINAFFIEGILAFPSLSGAISSLIFIAFSILLYSRIMSEAKIRKLKYSTAIWINSGVLVLYTSHFFYFALYNVFLDISVDFLKIAIQFKTFVNAFYYQVFTVVFILARNKKGI